MRYTEKRNGKNVIPLRNAVCGVDLPKWSIDKHSDIQSFLRGDAVDRLAELEDAIEQGKMIELPCKVGDTVYLVHRIDKEAVIENGCVTGMNIDESGLWVFMRLGNGRSHCIHSKSKGLYFSWEEAEKRLKELQNG